MTLSSPPLSTADIAAKSVYFDTPASFFANFADAWTNARCQVLKLETKQDYDETGDPSYDLLKAGRFDEALKAFALANGDARINALLEKNHVDFIRCRPVVLPFDDYLRWEFESYRISIAKSRQRVYCVLREKLADVFDRLALHDFMVFDRFIAFIHDYDDSGKIQGGWRVDDASDIDAMIALYGLIKAECVSFPHCLREYS